MSSNDDRERSLERLLKTPAPLPMGDPADDCVDAEMWRRGGSGAAWYEASTREVEQHLSTCARCQAMAAAFVRSEPVVATTKARAVWRGRWLAPVGVAAAAAMAVWLVAPWRVPTPGPETSMARNEPSTAELPAATPPVNTSVPSSPRQKEAMGRARPGETDVAPRGPGRCAAGRDATARSRAFRWGGTSVGAPVGVGCEGRGSRASGRAGRGSS